jgi:Holliday junction resolvasome RuvABC endonuclease subunit
MKSFLDGEETWTSMQIAGFDPDLHKAGLAIIDVRQSNKARKKIVNFHITSLRVEAKLKGLDAAQAMVARVCEVIGCQNFLPIDYAIVESQQSYFKDTDSRAKIVGQANDLIMLATVSGAAAAMLMQQGTRVDIKLPAQWKGQRKKENMHRKAKDILEGQKLYDPSKFAALDGMTEHEWDALCMALKGAGYDV